jgi:hypothetical protein
MKLMTSLLTSVALVAFAGLAYADDHLAQAQSPGHGLAPGTVGSTHEQDKGSGQGSPFFGEDRVTPSSDQGQEHAQVKPRSGH